MVAPSAISMLLWSELFALLSMLPSRRFIVALALVVLTSVLLFPAFLTGWVGLLFGLVPLAAAVIVVLKPR